MRRRRRPHYKDVYGHVNKFEPRSSGDFLVSVCPDTTAFVLSVPPSAIESDKDRQLPRDRRGGTVHDYRRSLIRKRANFHHLPFDLAVRKFVNCFVRDLACDGDVGALVGDGDLADLFARKPRGAGRFGGEGAEYVAGADLFLAPAKNLQRDHRRHQRLVVSALQRAEAVPLRFVAGHLLDGGDAAAIGRAAQAERPAVLVGAAGAADAVDVDLGIGRHVDVDDRFKT